MKIYFETIPIVFKGTLVSTPKVHTLDYSTCTKPLKSLVGSNGAQVRIPPCIKYPTCCCCCCMLIKSFVQKQIFLNTKIASTKFVVKTKLDIFLFFRAVLCHAMKLKLDSAIIQSTISHESPIPRATFSVTRLGYFWTIFGRNFITIVAQKVVHDWASYQTVPFK